MSLMREFFSLIGLLLTRSSVPEVNCLP